VAKNVYAATRSGWFSCRSVCYLAASRPVVVQDTGWSEVIPAGEGLLAFNDIEQAQRGIETVENDYARHQQAARAAAAAHFDSDKVLGDLLGRISL
jgi:glycosyltransferase involved in cell wall biosynthesis